MASHSEVVVEDGVSAIVDATAGNILLRLRICQSLSVPDNETVDTRIDRAVLETTQNDYLFAIPELDISWTKSSKEVVLQTVHDSTEITSPLEVKLYCMTKDPDITTAPVITMSSTKVAVKGYRVILDIMMRVPELATANVISSRLLWHYRQQLKAVGCCLKHYAADTVPEVFHCFLKDDRLVSVVYPRDKSEEELKPARQVLHKLLNLPADRPCLRRWNAWTGEATDYLTNVHSELKPKGVEGGLEFYVDGDYLYYHYMQGGIDDNKWGCAYRSLQTLASWLRLQGYTRLSEPTHREIQQTLVDIGDKQPQFVGSRQWIGSSEVGFVLDQRYGVSYRILFVSSGAELASKGRELAEHFRTQGSPVMIGGGVLAHTILGVSWSEVTGDTRWLVLDPHYTGAEDPALIRRKGWVGWKGPSFWDANAHYNLCMPQRPLTV